MTNYLPVLRSFDAPGVHLCGLAWDGTHLWHSDGDTHSLYRLDVHTGSILTTLSCPDVRTGLSYDGGYLWQVAGRPKRIRVIEPPNGEVRREIPLGANAEFVCGLLVQEDSYWIGPESEDYLEQHSLATQTLLRQIGPVPSGDGIAIVGSTLWYTSYKDGSLVALDKESGAEIRRYRLTGHPTDLCWDGALFWYNDYDNKQICAVRPDLL